ncbi:uncharacterized protein LOC131949758 isoform X2 [Physella acuta]|uniref:uncharacterized protein LOC131949758 isoform X2 n=1 Tax=Physella acuta TaxID=109671 RepID=UPI0027DC4C0E|nr:uncharacterized protein LOC131949758 isoform X2 [Physella acuta]
MEGACSDIPPLELQTKINEFEQEQYDVDICYEGSSKLENNWQECTKYPGHKDFIPFTNFGLANLPDRFRDEDILKLIKNLACLTVSLQVAYTSTDRPKYHKNEPYPFAKHAGKDVLRVGSGRVWNVYRNDNEGIPCPCSLCKEDGLETVEWGRIVVLTALHVVFDKSEAERTKCQLGYNDDRCNPRVLQGCDVFKRELDSDMCVMECITHDMRLLDVMKFTLDRYKELCDTVSKNYSTDAEERVVVIVSHPHGLAKRVSIGQLIRCEQLPNSDTKYTYTAPTCPGSSGAPVYLLGKRNASWSTHHHSGGGISGNVSGVGWLG